MSENFLNDYEKNRNKIYHMHDNKSDLDVDDAFEIIKEDGRNINDKKSDVDSKIEDFVNSDNSEIIDIDDAYLLDKEYRDVYLKKVYKDNKLNGAAHNALSLSFLVVSLPVIFLPFVVVYTFIMLLYVIAAPMMMNAGVDFSDPPAMIEFVKYPLIIAAVIAIVVFIINRMIKSDRELNCSILKNKLEEIEKGNYTFKGISSKDINYSFIKENIQDQLSKEFSSTLAIAKNLDKNVLLKYLDVENNIEGIDLDNIDNLVKENDNKIVEINRKKSFLYYLSIGSFIVSVLVFVSLLTKFSYSLNGESLGILDKCFMFFQKYPLLSMVLVLLVIVGIVTNREYKSKDDDKIYQDRINLVTLRQRMIEKNNK